MNKFDSLFFAQYVNPSEKIEAVFHRHIFVIIEDILLWTFFGAIIPAFLYAQNTFDIQLAISKFSYSMYMLLIYGVLMYKLFDWYADVWIATDRTIVAVKWRYFTSNLLYIPYEKIEGIEIRTRSWFTAMIGMSDVIVKLMGNESFALSSAAKPNEIVEYLQNNTQHKKSSDNEEDREPFQVLVETLSDVVKGHLVTGGKNYITKDYIEKLDDTLTHGIPIDLRSRDEKVTIENWKNTYEKHEKDDSSEGSSQAHH